ncbi:MAG: selenocysteine-specific translation elongation factor [Bacteroidales bacterium]|nr:selenocysteine-specific translation elongation factor [Bacteroidales bacterium]
MKHLIMGTAGHIDHGKTSLIKALTNIDCDTHKEEKRRGITINLGFSYLNLPNGESIGIIDVPGHKDFINTMVSGACGIDFVLLVIAADSGIMPQTIEHINIITALGIKRGIVALTKIDLVDDELIEMAKSEILEYLKKTSLKDAPIVGVSAITGTGKDELIQAIEKIIAEVDEKENSSLFRMYIDRIFSVKGFGSVVTGSVLSGSIQTKDEVFLLPGNNEKLRIRSIERHGKPVESVVAGDRAAINLIGLNNEDFERGMIISNKFLEETSMIDAQVSLFDNNISLPLWSNITFHTGTFDCQARMHLINKATIQPNEEAIVQIHLRKPGIFINKDKFIIRNSSGDITLGGGFVMDAAPLHHRRRTPKLIDSLTQLSEHILSEQSIKEMINGELKKEFKPFGIEEISNKLNIPVDEIKNEINKGRCNFGVYKSTECVILISTGNDNSFQEKLLNILKEHHEKNKIFPNGLDVNEITGKIGFSKLKTEKLYIELLLQKMLSANLVEKYKNTWIIAGHKPILDNQTKKEIDWLENEIRRYETEKPVITEIEEKAVNNKIQKNKLKMYLSYLASIDKIQLFQNDFVHSSIINKFRVDLLKKLSVKNEGLDFNEFKEIIGGTKKFRALLTDMFENEKIITVQRGAGVDTTKFFITQTGKKRISEHLS